jgi:hypothetical protein
MDCDVLESSTNLRRQVDEARRVSKGTDRSKEHGTEGEDQLHVVRLRREGDHGAFASVAQEGQPHRVPKECFRTARRLVKQALDICACCKENSSQSFALSVLFRPALRQ